MDLEVVIKKLEALGSPDDLAGMARYGIMRNEWKSVIRDNEALSRQRADLLQL